MAVLPNSTSIMDDRSAVDRHDQPAAWPAKVVPLCVNVTSIRSHTAAATSSGRPSGVPWTVSPTTDRWDWGTGGLSHQLGSERAGVVNPEFDMFLDNLVNDPMANTRLTHTDFIREAAQRSR